MRLVQRQRTPLESFEPLLKSMFETFYGTEGTRDYAEALWGKATKPYDKSAVYALALKRLMEAEQADPKGRWNVIVDEDADGKIVAAAEWYIIPTFHDSVLDDWVVEADYFETPEQNKIAEQSLLGLSANWRNTIYKYCADKSTGSKGEPHLRLQILFVLPDYQGMGAGKACLKWGMDLSDLLGAAIWVEASPEGAPFYASQGSKP